VQTPPLSMSVVRLCTLMKRYGGQRHPRVETYDAWKERGELVQWEYVPPGSTAIYVSHEWTGTNRPDHDGTQMYHLLLMFERLQNGEVKRTEMFPFHSLAYGYNHSTTAEEWKRVLSPEETYIWYDGFCVPKSRGEDEFRSIPSYIRRCDFMVILAPGCVHLDRIDQRTQRRMNLCYRTYRLQARCVFELFCTFLTTRGAEKVRPALLVRSGTSIPNWSSPLECLKLAVGTSSFKCCEENHATITHCRRPVSRTMLDLIVKDRVCSLFACSNNVEARFTLCYRNYWFRGLIDNTSMLSWKSVSAFKKALRWSRTFLT
jgi:hypothetical protein